MRVRKHVLRALTDRTAWLQWGALFGAPYFATTDDRQVRQGIEAAWASFQGEEVSEKFLAEILSLMQPPFKGDISEVYALPLEESKAIARKALVLWRGEKILLDASQDMLLGEPNFGKIAAEFEELDHAVRTQSKRTEFDPQENIEKLIELEGDCVKFPTGLSRVDEQLDGGLWAKELGVLMAPPFKGKTYAMVHLGASALLSGRPVLHMSLEISAERTAIRYYQALLDEPRYYVAHNAQQVRSRIQGLDLPGWKICDYSAHGLTMGEFRRVVLKTTEEFGEPPLVLVDYLDLLTGNQYSDGKRFELADIAERMRRVANEAECGVWTGSQVHRAGYEAEVIQMAHVAESVGKVEKADVIITLNQSATELEQSVMRWHIAKARERQLTDFTIPVTAKTAHQRFEDRRRF